jgi:hypothetical protein
MDTLGLSKRQICSIVNSAVDAMKMQLPREYSNVLIRQGRAKDTGFFSSEEQDMEAMCDAYRVLLVEAIGGAIEANNKKITDEVKSIIRG